ncbi:carcinoembryonic antigen-related cell adhesion molecule 1-like [Thunnus thynnus]|uniref:carcinoembryonic antigen-related cell adhesion molecule 1-like n=1 Tax=Thunnus thynnus TaxID=8237 RepID=UPI003526C5D9
MATCIPSCTFTWKHMGKTFLGDQVRISILQEEDEQKFASRLQMTASDYSKIEPLTCEATNTLNQASITATQNLTVIDPISVRPTSLPVAGEPLSLQCLGSQNPTSITWLKNKHPMPAYERVRFSADNITMTFSPLLQADDGLYQCVVAEGAAAILSVGYKMQVNYGPDKVLIVKPNTGSVGERILVLPGSTTELQCLADCFPVCSITWYYHDTLLATNASIFFTPVTPPYQAALTCVAFNSVTKKNRMAETTVVVPDGPKNVTISGPDSLEVGVTASFTCSAECTPPCSFTWTLYGKKMMGRVIDITVTRHISTESISCQAENAFTGKTAMVNEMLSVSEPHWCGC